MEKTILTILIIMLIFCMIALIWLTIMSCKNTNTYKNCMIIINAMSAYNRDCYKRGSDDYVYYDAASDYDKIMYRIFDWGYENILPKEDMEKIRPFIKEAK